MDFSQRMGLAPAIKVAQVDSIDRDLKNSLWNVVISLRFGRFRHPAGHDKVAGSNLSWFATQIYSEFYKAPLDTIPYRWTEFKKVLRESFFKLDWHRLYSFVEFIVTSAPEEERKRLTTSFNEVLERENSAYRFVSERLTPITSSDEISEIESALLSPDRYSGVRTHIQTALNLLTDRENPDYRNSIKESISAVESFAKKVVGNDKATLGQALKILEENHNLHASLKSAFMTLYGYTSDAGGIRHAILDNTVTPTKADARFMLICCSAFINFAIDSIED
ncbi:MULTISPECIES: AbiJ-NTD4 domain-containing protein [unclassified Pseudomonas]|uniref:AbiJ-NTD4 domain-containing protein n=1 Tax=unclassified Pseudomonas TaxID=196821 RepID=UPI003397BF3F